MRIETSTAGGGRRRSRNTTTVEAVEGWSPLANAVLALGVIPKDTLSGLVNESVSSNTSLMDLLRSSGLIEPEILIKAYGNSIGVDYVDLERYTFNAAASSLLPVRIVKQYGVLPIGWKFGTPVVAFSDPENLVVRDELKSILGRDFQPVVANPVKIAQFASRLYGEEIAPTIKSSGGAPVSAAQDDVGDSIFATMFAQDGVEVQEAPPPPPAPKPSEVPVGVPAMSHEVASSPPPPPPEDTFDDAVEVDDDAQTYDLGSFTGGSILFDDEFDSEGEDSEMPSDLDYLSDFGLEDEEDEESIPPLANSLIAAGRVTPDQMQTALEQHRTTGKPLAQVLTEMNAVTEADLIRAMASEIGLQFVDLTDYPIDENAVSKIPMAMARRHRVLAIGYDGDTALVAVANPSDMMAMDDLRSILGREFRPMIATASQIGEFIDRLYRMDEETESAAKEAAAATSPSDFGSVDISNLESVTDDAPVVRFVNSIILQALNERASDIHIEPTETDLRVRYRIDGVLHDFNRAPKAITQAVIARLKVMGELNIAEHRIPQDGRISLSAGNRKLDLRVASLPTVYGEKIVMRVLDKSSALLSLEDLGFYPDVLERYEEAYRKPYGTILVTGPTGSGKSTTLYATLNILNSPDKHILTVEDPVEYQLTGINQMQVNPKAGLTFARCLRAILRADPDIVLVGEIRDSETAHIAIEAALTGHMVLSSLHTNEAASTPMRLLEMDVEPFLVTSALRAVVTQRLARKLCVKCKEPHDATEEEIHVAGIAESTLALAKGRELFRPVGCAACSRTGYRGRIAIAEVMVMSEEIERMIYDKNTSEEIKRIAIEQGMITMRQDGLRKALDGNTSIEEVLRVVA